MKHLNYFDILAKKDVRELKEALVQWAKRNPKAVLLFSESDVKCIEQRIIEQEIDGVVDIDVSVATMWIEELLITWRSLGGEKLVLNSISRYIDNVEYDELYEQPITWENATLWYQFK